MCFCTVCVQLRKAVRFMVAAPSLVSKFLSVFLWRHYCISDRLKFHIWIRMHSLLLKFHIFMGLVKLSCTYGVL